MDQEAEYTLAALTEAGRSRSAAIRDAIMAAYRAQRAARLRAEAEAIASDPDDRAESLRVRAQMESMRAW